MEEKKKAVPEGEASLPVQELPADVLLEVFGGLFVQVFGQLLAHLRRDIRGQLLHREGCFPLRNRFFTAL